MFSWHSFFKTLDITVDSIEASLDKNDRDLYLLTGLNGGQMEACRQQNLQAFKLSEFPTNHVNLHFSMMNSNQPKSIIQIGFYR